MRFHSFRHSCLVPSTLLNLGLLLGITGGVMSEDVPTLVIGDAAAAEPPVGAGVVSMLVTLSAPAAARVTATFESRPDTATAADFTPLTGVVEIPAGATRAMIRIPLLADAEAEETEQFFVRLSEVQGAVLTRGEGRATVLNAGRMPVVWSESTLLFEDGPPDPTHLWVDDGGHGPLTIRWQLQEVPPAAELGWSPATAGADFDPALRSVTGRGAIPLPLVALPDEVVEPGETDPSREKISLRFEADSPVGYASFVPEFLGNLAAEELGPHQFIKIPVATTDGQWLAFGLWRGTHLALYHRGRGMAGTWQQAPTIAFGPGLYFTEMIMRRGRLAVSTSHGMALYEAPNRPGAAAWTAINPPAESGTALVPLTQNAHAGFSFDGDALIIRERSPASTVTDRLQFFERMAPTGGWAIVQEELYPSHAIQSTTVDGDTAFVAASGPDVRIDEWRRTGPADRPWVRQSTIPLPPPRPEDGVTLGYDVLALCGDRLHARHIGAQSRESLIFQRDGSGEWQIEQCSLEPASAYSEDFGPRSNTTTFISPGVLVHNHRILAHTGNAPRPWRLIGYLPQFVAINDAQAGVALHANFRGPLPQIVASVPGALMTVFDEDSAHWKVEHAVTGGAPPFYLDEPATGAMVVNLVLSGPLVPFAVSVGTRLLPGTTATPGLDFVGPPLRLESLRLPGFKPAAFPLTILADSIAEGEESLGLELHSPSYGRILDPNPLLFTIRDRRAMLAAPSSIVTITEPDAGHLDHLIPCRLAIPVMTDLLVPLSIESRGATPSADFAVPPTMLVGAGARSCAIPVRVLADNLEEGIETFFVRLGAVPGLSITPSLVQIRLIDRFLTGRGTEADAYTVPQNAPFSAGTPDDAAPSVTANDPGLDGSIRLAHAPSMGTLTLEPSGRFAYSPPANYLGSTTFAYEARLGHGPGRLVDAAAAWKFLHPLDGVDPAVANPAFPSTWATTEFDDSAWGAGKGMLGYGALGQSPGTPDTDIGTPPSGLRFTAYFRHRFDAPEAMTADLVAQFSCDDAAILYINGTEVGRISHFHDPAFDAAADTYKLTSATGSVEGPLETALKTLPLRGVRLRAAGNVLAVSLHNWASVSSDLGFRLVSLDAVEQWSAPTPATLVVTDQSLPPVLQPDAYLCTQGGSLDTHFAAAGGLFANDGLLDETGAPFDPVLEVDVSRTMAGGHVTLLAHSGDFQYSPPSTYYGPDSFTYRVRDKDGWSAPATVSIDVQPSNEYDQWRLSHLGATTPTLATNPDQSIDGYGPTNLETFYFLQSLSDPRPAGLVPLEVFEDFQGRTGIRFTGRSAKDVIVTVEATSTLASDRWDPLARWQGSQGLFLAPRVTILSDMVLPNPSIRQFEIVELPPISAPRYYRIRLTSTLPAP